MDHFHLTIPLAQFIKGLRPFQTIRHAKGHASISFNGVFASFDTQMAGASLPATGSWPGVVQFSARMLLALSKLPPKADPVEMVYAQGRLMMGGVQMDAHCKTFGRSGNPAGAPLAGEGLTPDIWALDLERQIHEAARAAYPHLAPLGIECAELEAWLTGRLCSSVD